MSVQSPVQGLDFETSPVEIIVNPIEPESKLSEAENFKRIPEPDQPGRTCRKGKSKTDLSSKTDKLFGKIA